MPTYLEVAVNVPQVSGVFHYHLPPELEGRVVVGHLLVVPFGAQTVQGVALQFLEKPAVPLTRPVLDLVDARVVLTPVQIALAQQMAQSCLAPLASCIGLMLPPGLAQQADTLYALAPDSSGIEHSSGQKNDAQQRLISLLQKRGPLRGGQIDGALPRLNWRPAARSLARRGLVVTQSVLPPPRVQPKRVRTAQLACPPEALEAALAQIGRPGTQAYTRREAMLRFLLREPGPVDVAWVYAESGGDMTDLRLLAEKELVILSESETWRDPLQEMQFVPAEPPPLTRNQERVWTEVQKNIRQAAAGQATLPMLLHGVTGSGKTEIYLRGVEETLMLGKQAIILVPEISLTPQTVRRFVSRFPGRVGLLHSGLTDGERYDTWRRARAGDLSVVVGPRSALFTPFPSLGLIVVDEAHDDSYYQNENEPHYHAREAALACARLAGAACLLGSATPGVASTYQASQGQMQYLHLPSRILAHREAVRLQAERVSATETTYHTLEAQAATTDLPEVQVVDMRQELVAGNRSIFSRELQAALGLVLQAGQQAILFLNRRGSATYVFCRACGASLKCPHCDLPLTFHARPQGLSCHHCGYTRRMPEKCPQCGSPQIRQYGTGTERVEQEVRSLFPQAHVLRWDFETTRQKGAHEIILSHFVARRADVLVGTQMIAKGLDLPFVTLVGVVLAEVGLNLPDYSAAERTFAVLTQVAGRAGRSPLGGKVILQTFQPEHYAIQAAAQHNYKSFYQQELAFRRQLGYPPFNQLARLEYRHVNNDLAERAAHEMARQLRAWIEAEDRRLTTLVGPVPCFFGRVNGQYRWQIVLRGPDPASLLRDRPLGDWRVEINPPSLL